MILIKARNIKSMNEEIEGYKYNLHTQVLLLVTIRVCNCALSGDAFFVFYFLLVGCQNNGSTGHWSGLNWADQGWRYFTSIQGSLLDVGTI